MIGSAGFATTAHLIADPARARMLIALLDGRALPAGELAHAAGVTAQTASAHLLKLLAGGLLAVEKEGRHRYYRLAGSDVAEAIERLATIQPVVAVRRKALSREAQALRFCRSCYDHLAGRVGVAIAKALQGRDYIRPLADKRFAITATGATWFAGRGIDIATVPASSRGLARQCLDWTEREHHLAGPLGVKLLEALCRDRWLRREQGSRLVSVTHRGWAGLRGELGIRQTDILEEFESQSKQHTPHRGADARGRLPSGVGPG
jgi:DNA-binding transcriptional ArsR family regulator